MHKEVPLLWLTIKLILNDVVERLEKKKDEVMVLCDREQEPGCGKGLEKVEQFIGSDHRQALQIGGN